MPVIIDMPYKTDISKPIRPTILRELFVTGNQLAHRFDVTLSNGTSTLLLDGATVEARFVRADGATVNFSGSFSDNKATVTLPASCYVVPGRFTLDIRVLHGESITSVFFAEGSLVASATADAVADPSAKILSYEELTAKISAFETALNARDRPENLLDNSDFRASRVVNQREWQSGSTVASWKYFIDRWFVEGGGAPTIGETGVMLPAGTAKLCQDIHREDLVGQTVTAVVWLSDGTVIAKSGTVPEWSEWYNFIVTTVDGVHLTLSSAALSKLRFRITPNGKTVLCAALYIGAYTADTVPVYQPKSYLAELEACRRTFRKSTNLVIPGGTHNATTFVGALDMNGMRVQPSVDAFTCSWLQVGGTNFTSGVTASVGSFYRIDLTNEANMSTGQGGVAYVANLELSADW